MFNKLPLKYYSGVKMCIWPKITSGSTICSTASPAKNKRKKNNQTQYGVMTQMSVCQSETEKHAGLSIIWYCQSEWVKIFKEIWVILMFLDWQNLQWTANYMLVIRTGNTSKVFNMTVYVSVIIFTITITVLTTCWMAVGWGPVEPPELKASQHFKIMKPQLRVQCFDLTHLCIV